MGPFGMHHTVDINGCHAIPQSNGCKSAEKRGAFNGNGKNLMEKA